MTFNPTALGAAPLVAAALGRSLGVEVVVDGQSSTAWTDGRKIVLPTLPVDVDEQTAAMLWGFIHHEAGHCRHTDFEARLDQPEFQTDALLGRCYQALEDARMERAHMALYPGAARVLGDLVDVLVDVGFFRPLPTDADAATAFHAFVLKHLRANVLGQSALADQAAAARACLEEALGPGMVTRLVAQLQEILAAESTDDSINLAYRIRQLLRDELEAKEQPPANADDGSDPPGSDAPDGDAGTVAAAPDASGSGASDGDGASSASPDGDEDGDTPVSAAGGVSDGDGDDPSSVEALKRILEDDVSDPSLGDLGGALAETLRDKVCASPQRTVALPGDDVRNAGWRDAGLVQEARKVSSRLAIQLKRTLESYNEVTSDPSRRGKRISRRHLGRVAFNDYRVFAHREWLPAVNTAVVSLIDVSGSMSSKEHLAGTATLASALALESIDHVSHAVGAFPSRAGSNRVELVQDFPESAKRVSSRFVLSARGTTPMAEALLWAGNRLTQRPEARRIVFIATDGDPDDVDATVRVLTHLSRQRIEVHGLGIETDDEYELFDSFARVDRLSELPRAFLKLFQRLLRQAG